ASTLAVVGSVYLYRVSDGAAVGATVNTTAGGDAIVLKPTAALAAYTTYAFVVTAAVADVAGVPFEPFTSQFTTGAAPVVNNTPVKFTQLPQAAGAGRNYFSLATGPDGRLYAGADDGRIYRFDIKADGTLAAPVTIDTIRRYNSGNARFIAGLAFDPASTKDNPVLWVSHTATSSLELGGTAGANWTGKISVLTGPNLGLYRSAVTGLPRSVRDHFNNQLAFGPDGALYWAQAAQSSMGRADPIWGYRAETPLSAAILRLDLKLLGTKTLSAITPDGGGTYNPNATGAPLTVYADGVRNVFDLVWHRNGSLYAPANGSAAGGNTPAGGGAPALTNVSKAETDYLFRVTPGAYYGHPNPKRGHYVLNGGNPTSGTDPFEVTDYPIGVKPDPKWQKAVFDFTPHQSPAGAIEYRGTAFGGALDGRLLVCRYSGGDDVIVLTLNPDGTVAKSQTGIPGLTGLADPVDLVQRPGGAGLYVIELAKKRITLLKAG
ncbi:MAG TPA: PQQ-dependent sugar dehydrogenase, partial [Humisphaera sp.]